jgi:serine/threonine protein kinase
MSQIFSRSIIDQLPKLNETHKEKEKERDQYMNMGTKLISQGTFGCIFYPAIECDGSISKNKKYASKLVKNNKTDINEYVIGKMIKNIKLYEYYYAPVVNICSINLAKIDRRERDMCKIIRAKTTGSDNTSLVDSTNSYSIMKIPFIENISIIDYFINPETDKKEILTYILYSYEYLQQNIKTLNEHGIIHFDLKLSNILIEKSKKIPIIIDFGLSIPISDIRIETYKKYFYAYSPSYYIWCIDIHIICYLVKVNPILTKDALIELIDEYVKNNIALKIFSDRFVQRFRNIAVDYYSKLLIHTSNAANTRDAMIKKLLKYIKTWDSYSLSLMFLCFIQFISFNGFIHNKLIIEFSKLLLLNFHPNPEKRLSFDQTKNKYNAIFNVDETTHSYKKLLENFNRGMFVSRTNAETIKEDKMTPSLGPTD